MEGPGKQGFWLAASRMSPSVAMGESHSEPSSSALLPGF